MLQGHDVAGWRIWYFAIFLPPIIGTSAEIDAIFKGLSSYLDELSELISSILVDIKEGDNDLLSSKVFETFKANSWKLQVFLENGCLGSCAAIAFSTLKLLAKAKACDTEVLQARAILIVIDMLKILKNVLSNQSLFFPSTELRINFDALDRLSMCLKFLSGSSGDDGAATLLSSIFTGSKEYSVRPSSFTSPATEAKVCLFNQRYCRRSKRIVSSLPTSLRRCC